MAGAMSSYYTTHPGPPAGRPPADRELIPGPPAEEPSRQTTYAAAVGNDGATEHVLLTLDDLPWLRPRGHVLLAVLHREARAFTDKFANADHDTIGVQANLVTDWPNWKLDIANHKLAPQLVGPGVKAFTVEFIDGTKDPNRCGRPRLDLVIRHSNNAYCVYTLALRRKLTHNLSSFQPVLQSLPHMNRPVLQSLPHMNGVGLVQPGSFHPIAQSSAKMTSGKPHKAFHGTLFRMNHPEAGLTSQTSGTFSGGCGSMTWAITRGL